MTKCETCKKGAEPVPYIVHESAMARQERTITCDNGTEFSDTAGIERSVYGGSRTKT